MLEQICDALLRVEAALKQESTVGVDTLNNIVNLTIRHESIIAACLIHTPQAHKTGREHLAKLLQQETESKWKIFDRIRTELAHITAMIQQELVIQDTHALQGLANPLIQEALRITDICNHMMQKDLCIKITIVDLIQKQTNQVLTSGRRKTALDEDQFKAALKTYQMQPSIEKLMLEKLTKAKTDL